MILLLGASGYIGSAFAAELNRRGVSWVGARYFNAMEILSWKDGITMVINAAAYIPRPSVALCDQYKAETIRGNVVFPAMLSYICRSKGIVLCHISTACLWNDGAIHSEDDPPQRAFNGHCGFYVGTKVMSEQEVRTCNNHYIWRIRLPFDHSGDDRNYMSKLAGFDEVWDHDNSLSHRGDFAKACLDLVELKADFGTYNVMNPGSIRARAIVSMMTQAGIITTPKRFVPGEQAGAIVSVDKLLSAGVKMRSVADAVSDSISRWTGRVVNV